MTDPHMYVNGDGELRWQPQLEDGTRLWRDYSGYAVGHSLIWRHSLARISHQYRTPVLYRSKRRAVRVAARKERKIRAEFK